MNRRDFLRSTLAGALALESLRRLGALARPPGLPRADWVDGGIINAGGTHEPYTFVVRRGGQPRDARRQYERAQSEEVIRALRDRGVEMFHTHLYKGFGMLHEKPEMEDTVRAAAIAHRYGMRVDTYVQWNTLLYETFFAEEPRGRNWIQRDDSGRPIRLSYGFQQAFRFRPCFSNSEYLEYLKNVVRYAVEEVKTDLIHFDNYDLNPEPESCHCEHCVRAFREFLETRYPSGKRRERFGFDNLDFVTPPVWNAQNPPGKLQIIFDPVIQEWIAYRCHMMADALRKMAEYAKSLNPQVAIEVNPHGITGGNRPWEAGVDHPQFLKYTEVFWTEERNFPRLLPTGHLVSTIRSYKLARRYRNVLFTYIGDHPVSAAECLAFNQTIGYAGEHPLPPHVRQYIAFYRKHRDFYTGAEDAANVALLRSYPSITYHHARAQLSAVLTEQALIQAKVPFDLIFDEHVRDLSKYRVLVLPGSECLSGEQLESIHGFVREGGGLVAIGQAGLYDEWRRLRTAPGLKGLVDAQPEARAYQETVLPEELYGRPSRKIAGKGRAAWLPEVRYDGPLPQLRDNFAIGSRFWKLPANWRAIVDAVRWAAQDDLPVRAGGPLHLIANVTRQPAKKRTIVHLVNYNARSGKAVKNVRVSCRGARPEQVTLYSPDQAEPRPVKAGQSAAGWTFTVPEVKVYTVAVVSYA